MDFIYDTSNITFKVIEHPVAELRKLGVHMDPSVEGHAKKLFNALIHLAK